MAVFHIEIFLSAKPINYVAKVVLKGSQKPPRPVDTYGKALFSSLG